MIAFFGLALLAFLLGSIPFGLLIARSRGVDLLNFGSGNIGATNAMRALGTKLGLLVFALDVLKGTIPTLLGRAFLPTTLFGLDQQPLLMLLGAFAILGHCFSPWLGFKGGKGISTILGVGLGAIPLCALLSFVTMVVVLAISRYVSLASMIAVASTMVWNRVLGDSPQMLPVLGLLTVFLVYRHRSNIGRLLNGTESRFTFRKSEAKPAKAENSLDVSNGESEDSHDEQPISKLASDTP